MKKKEDDEWVWWVDIGKDHYIYKLRRRSVQVLLQVFIQRREGWVDTMLATIYVTAVAVNFLHIYAGKVWNKIFLSAGIALISQVCFTLIRERFFNYREGGVRQFWTEVSKLQPILYIAGTVPSVRYLPLEITVWQLFSKSRGRRKFLETCVWRLSLPKFAV